MRFLQIRDIHFDMCRAFLILLMIIDHVFRRFYIHGYNTNITVVNLIGFVFLAAITSTAVNIPKIGTAGKEIIFKILFRSLKLFFLFIISNFFILILFPKRAIMLADYNVFDILLLILLGTRQDLIAFDVLVPISVVMLFSFLPVYYIRKLFLNILILIIVFLLILIIETNNFLNYYGIKLILSGIIGCSSARILILFDWSKVLVTTKKISSLVIVISLTFIYFLISSVLLGHSGIYYSKLIIFTFILLTICYSLSNLLNLHRFVIINYFSNIFSNFMLFSYMFHLLIVNVLILFFNLNRFNLFYSILIVLFVFLITFFSSLGLKKVCLKFQMISKIYNFVFK